LHDRERAFEMIPVLLHRALDPGAPAMERALEHERAREQPALVIDERQQLGTAPPDRDDPLDVVRAIAQDGDRRKAMWRRSQRWPNPAPSTTAPKIAPPAGFSPTPRAMSPPPITTANTIMSTTASAN
jgi:hypothetical protein